MGESNTPNGTLKLANSAVLWKVVALERVFESDVVTLRDVLLGRRAQGTLVLGGAREGPGKTQVRVGLQYVFEIQVRTRFVISKLYMSAGGVKRLFILGGIGVGAGGADETSCSAC